MNERRLKRWHPLLSGSTQEHIEGKSGSETFYSPESGDRLLVLCALRWGQKIRRPKELGWRLWWFGFWVDEKYWKARLEKLARWYDTMGPRITKFIFPRGGDEISDAAFGLFRRLRSAKTRIRSALFRQLRKRIKTEQWETLMRIVFEIQAGRFEGWNRSVDRKDPDLELDKEILDRGLGLHRARIDRLGDGKPWLEGDIDDPLVTLSQAINNVSLVAVLAHTSGAELIRARNEFVEILRRVGIAAARNEATRGKHAFGLGGIAQFTRRLEDDAHGLMLLLWLAFRKAPGIQEQIDQFLHPTDRVLVR